MSKTEEAVATLVRESRFNPTLFENAVISDLNQPAERQAARATFAPGLSVGRRQPQFGTGAARDPGEPPHIPISATPYKWTDPKNVPRRDHLFGLHFTRGFISMTAAPGGAGKTALKVSEALAMICGRDLLQIGHQRQLCVWLVNLEDPREDLTRRIQAAAKHFGLTPDDIGGRLFVDSGREQQFVIAESTRSGARIIRPVVEDITGEIKRNRIDVLIIDPFVSCHRVSENDNAAIAMVAKEWGRVAHEGNCAVELVHHTRKTMGEESETTVESARGAKALADACRSVAVIIPMTEREAEKYGVEERGRHFRAVNGKATFAPPSDLSTWYKLESVDLGNADFGQQSDKVGVVTLWQPPDLTLTMSAVDTRRLQERLSTEAWRKDPQAKAWAGYLVAEILALDAGRPVDRARIKRVLDDGIASGGIMVVSERDEKRIERSFLRPGIRRIAPQEP